MRNSIKGLCLVAVAGMTSAAQAQVLLIDLSVPNQLTITGGADASAITTTASDFTGVLLADFFSVNGTAINQAGAGNITTAAEASDGTPSIFRSGGTDAGLNLWDWSSSGTNSFTSGVQAFSGSGTWTVSAAIYADLLGGATSGDVFANADTTDDLPANGIIGTYQVIPTPGAASLLGLAGVAAVRRRR